MKNLALYLMSVCFFVSLSACNEETKTQISIGCNETMEVESADIAHITAINHLRSPERCPGFFAVLADDARFLKASSIREKVEKNSCNEVQTARRRSARRSLSREKRKLIKSLERSLNHKIMADHVYQMSRPKDRGGMWNSRYHNLPSANEAPQWIKEQVESFPGGKVQAQYIHHTNTTQMSVEALIPARVPSNKYIVLGAHLDSTNRTNKELAPGANDNASGSAVLLETLRVLLKHGVQADVNIVFYWYAAEEIGLVGSQEIARMYAEEEREVIGAMNLDMAFYAPKKRKSIYLIKDYTDSRLTSRIRYLAKQFGFKPKMVRCGYACSDHASWTKYGFPSFFSRDDNSRGNFRRIHTTRDILDSGLSAKQALRFGTLALAFVVDYGL